MKNVTTMVGAMLLAVSAASCADPKEEAAAWGIIEANGIDGSQGIDSADGLTLNDSSGFGYCRYKDDKLSFAVGTKAPGNLETSSDYYLIVEGVEGPPSTNPYNSDGTPRTDEDRTFSGGTVYTRLNSRSFTADDMLEGECLVNLLAKSDAGDLTPVKYGKNRFQYLVNIECMNGLTNQSDPAGPLDINGFNATLWFDNCEE